MGWRKNRSLIDSIASLLTICEQSSQMFHTTFTLHRTSHDHDGHFAFGVDSLRKFKSEADSAVEAVRTILYTDLPTIHEELMVLVHTTNLIVEDLAHVLFSIRTHSISAISTHKKHYAELELSVQSCLTQAINLVRMAIIKTAKHKDVSATINLLCTEENHSNELEDSLIAILFTPSLPPEILIEQAKLVRGIGQIADHCKHLAFHIEIIMLAETE